MPFFCVTWRIENFSMCPHKRDDFLLSPEFRIPEVSNVRWRISLTPRRYLSNTEFVSCYLVRTDQDPSSDLKTFVTSFVVLNAVPKFSHKVNDECFEIGKDVSVGYDQLISREKLCKEGFLPDDVFTIRVLVSPRLSDTFQLYNTDLDKIPLPNPYGQNFAVDEVFARDDASEGWSLAQCAFVTRIPVQRRVFDWWRLRDLSAKRESGEKSLLVMNSELHCEGIKLLLLCYVKDGGGEEETLQIDVLRKGTDLRRTFVKCDVYLTTGSDVVLHCRSSEHVFDHLYSKWSFALIDDLDSSKHLIHKDSIKLRFHFRISYDPRNDIDCVTDSLRKLELDMEELFEYEISDAKLESASGERFPVHKFFLFAESPVFRAMFSTPTEEVSSGVVRMEDASSATVRHLKDYLYDGRLVGDLKVKDVLELYCVADKYLMEPLRQKCSEFLKINISEDNVCEMLVTLEQRSDADFSDFIYDFLITDMDFDGRAWALFMRENTALAAETMRKCFVRMKD